MLTEVQGSRFKENLNWADHYGEGPEWVANSPLTQEQRRHVLLGRLEAVNPARCEAIAAFFAGGWTSAVSKDTTFRAVGYTKKVNAFRYWKDDNVYYWTVAAYLLPSGLAQQWTERIGATFRSCQRFVLVQSNGDVEKFNVEERFKRDKRTFTSVGGAVTFATKSESEDRSSYRIQIWEPIGEVLYSTSISILGIKKSQWARASDLYNELADRIARAQGVKRIRVDLVRRLPEQVMPRDKQARSRINSTS